MTATAVPAPIDVDLDTRDLLRALAPRLNADQGKVKLELIFVDGEYVDGYAIRTDRIRPTETTCRCRRHAIDPACTNPSHKPTAVFGGR